jgi:hypothetical protein
MPRGATPSAGSASACAGGNLFWRFPDTQNHNSWSVAMHLGMSSQTNIERQCDGALISDKGPGALQIPVIIGYFIGR